MTDSCAWRERDVHTKVRKAHSKVRAGRPTDGPTDQPTENNQFRKQKKSFDECFQNFTCQNKAYSHDVQNKAVQNFPKQVKVLQLLTGNLGRSHKSTFNAVASFGIGAPLSCSRTIPCFHEPLQLAPVWPLCSVRRCVSPSHNGHS